MGRPLHVDRALEVTRWPTDEATAPPFLRAGAPKLHGEARWEPLCGPGTAPCHSSALRVGRLVGSGAIEVPDWNVLRALTVLEGSVTLSWPSDTLIVAAGQTAVVPACATRLTARLDSAHAVLSAPVA
jgi:hypothetical protein